MCWLTDKFTSVNRPVREGTPSPFLYGHLQEQRFVGQSGVGTHGALLYILTARCPAANPGDLWGLVALLGHANLNTVMTYIEPRLEDLAERMERARSKDKGEASALDGTARIFPCLLYSGSIPPPGKDDGDSIRQQPQSTGNGEERYADQLTTDVQGEYLLAQGARFHCLPAQQLLPACHEEELKPKVSPQAHGHMLFRTTFNALFKLRRLFFPLLFIIH